MKALLERRPDLHVSISHTTRARRPTEQAGREYYFVSVPEFQELIGKGEFLEYAQVFDNFYGTGRRAGRSAARPGPQRRPRDRLAGRPPGPQGHAGAALSIFILPPSRAALEERLRNRQTDSDEVIARRLRDAVGDMSHWDEFDYVVVNDDFERAVTDLGRIVDGDGEDLAADREVLKPLLADLVG